MIMVMTRQCFNVAHELRLQVVHHGQHSRRNRILPKVLICLDSSRECNKALRILLAIFWDALCFFVDLFSEQGQHHEEEHGGDFIAEARDWAGELISAQTMMGKILVTILLFAFPVCSIY